MRAKIIDGKAVAAQVRARIAEKVADFKEKYGRQICLAVVMVGNDPASAVYVNNKAKGCAETGMKSLVYTLPEETTQDELESLLKELNIDGLLVQVPIPKHLYEKRALAIISKEKDVDGFCAQNVGNLVLGNECSKACTPAGIMELIKSTGQPIEGKNAVVVGRSNTVGKPIALLLLESNATVTICHSKTQNMKDICKTADILVCAVGRKHFITADMVKDGAVVVDVGINRVDGKLCGDVDYEAVEKKASYITPVPGGVGPMTRVMLLQNTMTAAKSKIK